MLPRPEINVKVEKDPVEKKPEEIKSATAGQGIFDKNGARTVEYYFVPVEPKSDNSFGY